jgi:hypothetical protein
MMVQGKGAHAPRMSGNPSPYQPRTRRSMEQRADPVEPAHWVGSFRPVPSQKHSSLTAKWLPVAGPVDATSVVETLFKGASRRFLDGDRTGELRRREPYRRVKFFDSAGINTYDAGTITKEGSTSREEVNMRRMLFGLATASFVVFLAAPVSAADLTVWWNKSYYPEEDQQFDKIVAAFEKQHGIDVEYVYYTNEDVPRKVLAALTAGEPPDLSYGFLFDLQHTSRWAYDDVLEDVSDVVGGIEPNLLPSAMEAVRLLNGKTGKRSIYAMPVAQQI